MTPRSSPKSCSLLSDPAAQSSFKWSPSGESLLITDTNHFTSQVLPQHFRHNQLSSFVRQLNKHGFKRLKHSNSNTGSSILKSTSASSGSHSDMALEEQYGASSGQVPLEYMHPYFSRNDRGSWHLIRWNTGASSGSNASAEQASPVVSLRLDAMAEQNDYVNKQVENAEQRLRQMETALAEFNQRIAKQSLLIDKLSQLLPSDSNGSSMSNNQFQPYSMHSHQQQQHYEHQQIIHQQQLRLQHQQQQQQHFYLSHQNSLKRNLDSMQEENHQQLQAFDYEAPFQQETTFLTIAADSMLPEYPSSNSNITSSNNRTNPSSGRTAMPSLMQG
jgi:hypothetical protein